MAVTNIHPIRSTTGKAIRYILDPDKTGNGLYVESFMCEGKSDRAARQFKEFRDNFGTGRSTTEAQHIMICYNET